MLSRDQRGYSLLEFTLASALGLALLGAFVQLTARTLAQNGEQLTTLRAEQELRELTALLRGELRRAGSWQPPSLDPVNPARNPFARPAERLRLGDAGRCLLYAYDVDRNGRLSNDERLGFKLSGDALAIRRDGRGCDDSGWERVTDPRLYRVRDFRAGLLTEPLAFPGRLTMTRLRVTLYLKVELAGGARRTLKLTVAARNPLVGARRPAHGVSS